jgi:hypothetical protein
MGTLWKGGEKWMQIQLITNELVDAAAATGGPPKQTNAHESSGLFAMLLALLQGANPAATIAPLTESTGTTDAAEGVMDAMKSTGVSAPTKPTELAQAPFVPPSGASSPAIAASALTQDTRNSNGTPAILVDVPLVSAPAPPVAFELPQAVLAPIKSSAMVAIQPAPDGVPTESGIPVSADDIPAPASVQTSPGQIAPAAVTKPDANTGLTWLVSEARYHRLVRADSPVTELPPVPNESATLFVAPGTEPETAVSVGLAEIAKPIVSKSTAEFFISDFKPVLESTDGKQLDGSSVDTDIDLVSWPSRVDAPKAETATPAASKMESLAELRMTRPTIDVVNDFAVKSVRYMLRDNAQSIHVKLVPESLGELRIAVTSVNDVVQVHMAASNSTVRELLQHQQHALRESLARDGIDVSNIVFSSDASAGFGSQSFVGREQTPLDEWQRSLIPSVRRAPEFTAAMPVRHQAAHAGAFDVSA